jgi:hypothetical protein
MKGSGSRQRLVATRGGVLPHGCHQHGRVVTPHAGRVLRRFKGLALKNPNMGKRGIYRFVRAAPLPMALRPLLPTLASPYAAHRAVPSLPPKIILPLSQPTLQPHATIEPTLSTEHRCV